MGLDAYAINDDGTRLAIEYRDGFSARLINAEQAKEFDRAARKIVLLDGSVDGDFPSGGLGIFANASAANHIIYAFAGSSDDLRYTANQVLRADTGIKNGQFCHIPSYVLADPRAINTAKAFIECCAKLGLGIEISP